jgi:hypothetical protein
MELGQIILPILADGRREDTIYDILGQGQWFS